MRVVRALVQKASQGSAPHVPPLLLYCAAEQLLLCHAAAHLLQVSKEQLLAHCSSETLAALACSMASTVHAGGLQPEVVFGVGPGLAGATGGFTWVLQHFSKRTGRVCSPWIKVCAAGLQTMHANPSGSWQLCRGA